MARALREGVPAGFLLDEGVTASSSYLFGVLRWRPLVRVPTRAGVCASSFLSSPSWSAVSGSALSPRLDRRRDALFTGVGEVLLLSGDDGTENTSWLSFPISMSPSTSSETLLLLDAGAMAVV